MWNPIQKTQASQQNEMKALLVFVGALVFAVLAEEEKYTDKYDNVDLEEILKSERLLNNYFKCLMDEGSCTPDGKELKKSIPEALNDECRKCTEIQRKGAEKVIRHMIKNEKDKWEALEKKYDPEHNYWNKYKDELEKL